MKLTDESKVLLGILSASIGIIAFAVFIFSQPEKTFTREILLPASTATRGNKQASVYLVEFSDFQCPACRAAKPVIDELVKKYPDQLVFGYRHFPLDKHPFALKAAEAAEAAGAQGKFWEMYDYLFTNQDQINDEFLKQAGTAIQLDTEAYTQSLSAGTYKQKVETDRLYGLSIGINSTPTFYLNGKKLRFTSYTELQKQIEQALSTQE